MNERKGKKGKKKLEKRTKERREREGRKEREERKNSGDEIIYVYFSKEKARMRKAFWI